MRNKLSQYWFQIQEKLFPQMENELEVPLTSKLLQVIQILEIVRIEEFIRTRIGPGRPSKYRQAMARAFIAKAILNIAKTNMLIERLKMDKSLRRICGWDAVYMVPSESSFSRAFAEFAEMGLPEIVHESLIKEMISDDLVGHISRDSTKIKVRSKPKLKLKKAKKAVKRGRPRKNEKRAPKEPTLIEKQGAMSYEELINSFDTHCDVGTKVNSKGYKESWIGNKFHADVIEGDIPVSLILSSASVHDSQLAIPLAEKSRRRVTNLYDLADSAYDCKAIREHSRSLGHINIIDVNPRRSDKKVGFCPAKAVRYRQRSSVERFFGNLKDNFGGSSIWVRGSAKVFTHLMFGTLALTANQLLKAVT